MFKFIFGDALIIILFLFIVSQIIIPSIFPTMKYFWLFKKKPEVLNPPSPPSSLDDLDAEVEQSVKSFKESKEKVEQVKQKISLIQKKQTNI